MSDKMEEVAVIAAILLGFYPMMVLLVAITGPHSAFERAEYERFKAERRRKVRSYLMKEQG